MRRYAKRDFPVSDVRRFLEPGPVVLVSSGRTSTAAPAAKVDAPLIAECYASFECRLVDTSLIRKYSLFILKVVKAHVATAPRFPRTLHYRGDGLFMLAGPTVSRYRRWFKPENL